MGILLGKTDLPTLFLSSPLCQHNKKKLPYRNLDCVGKNVTLIYHLLLCYICLYLSPSLCFCLIWPLFTSQSPFPGLLVPSIIKLLSAIYYICHIFRGGFIFANFASRIRQAKVFASNPDAWMRLVYAILVAYSTQCTCKAGSIILPSENEWMISTDFCVHCSPRSGIYNVTTCTCENVLKSRFAKIWLAKYGVYSTLQLHYVLTLHLVKFLFEKNKKFSWLLWSNDCDKSLFILLLM